MLPALAPMPGLSSPAPGLGSAFARVFNPRTVAAAFYLSAVVALSRALTWTLQFDSLLPWVIELARHTRQSLISSLSILLCIALASALAERWQASERQAMWAEGLAVLPGAALGAELRLLVGAQAGQPMAWAWWAYTVGLWAMLGWLGQGLLRLAREEAAARQRLLLAQREHASSATGELEASLSALQAQIEPHFLFNTLATVKRLYETDPDQGREMMTHLTAYLRSALPSLRQRQGPLGEELALVQHYLNILQMRMGPRLSFSIDSAPGLARAAIPPMAVLTLVENAVKHGLSPLPQGGHIAVQAREGPAGELVVEVTDSGQGFQGQGGSGVGLANTRARLSALHGSAAALELEAHAERPGVTARLRLPLQNLPPGPSEALA